MFSGYCIAIDAIATLSNARLVPEEVAIRAATPSPLLAVITNAATRLMATPSENNGGQEVDDIPKEDDVAT